MIEIELDIDRQQIFRITDEEANRAARRQKSDCSEPRILLDPGQVSEGPLWVWGEFVSR